MNFSDILALAKQGYKPADIKELLAIEVPTGTPETQQEEKPQPDQEQVQVEQPVTEPEPVTATAPKESAQAGNEVVEELKATIKELQQQNIRQDLSGNVKDPQEDLNELVMAYM